LFSNYTKQVYSVNFESKKIILLDSNNTGIIGKITKIKKLIDYDNWATDDLGYLYKNKSLTENLIILIWWLMVEKIWKYQLMISQWISTEIGLLRNNSILYNVNDNSKISRD